MRRLWIFQGSWVTGLGLIQTFLSLLLASACADDLKVKGLIENKESGEAQPAADPEPFTPATPDKSTPKKDAISESTIESSGALLQLKSASLLGSSISSCFSPEFLTITEDMIMVPLTNPTPPPEPLDGRMRFLLPERYVAGNSILATETYNLVDVSTAGRTSVAADGLTDTYLRSLEIVANVVAHHCNLSDHAELCQCDSPSAARKLVERCLPGFDPNSPSMDDSINFIYEKCVENPNKLSEGMRRAIASLLSSYAFAAAR
jgi:hypothetical protein